MADTVKSFEEMKESLLKAMSKIEWAPAPEGCKCSQCDSSEMERTKPYLGSGPGRFRCKSCGNNESFYSLMAKSLFKVEPL